MSTYNQHNQSGDNIMHFGSQPRKLNDQSKEQIKQLLPAKSSVNITSVLGDGEAYSFANEIKSYLEEQGYEVDGVNQAIYSKPVKGQNIEKPKEGSDTYKITIGSKD